MNSRGWVVFLAIDLCAFAFLGIYGTGYGQTDLLISITDRHGVDSGDVPVMVIWVIGMLLCWRLWRSLDTDD